MATKRFVVDDDGKLKGLDTVQVEWTKQNGQWKMEEVVGSEKVSLGWCFLYETYLTFHLQFYPAQLVLLALGFLGPQQQCLKPLGVETDPRTNIKTPPNVRHFFPHPAILRGLTYL